MALIIGINEEHGVCVSVKYDQEVLDRENVTKTIESAADEHVFNSLDIDRILVVQDDEVVDDFFTEPW